MFGTRVLDYRGIRRNAVCESDLRQSPVVQNALPPLAGLIVYDLHS